MRKRTLTKIEKQIADFMQEPCVEGCLFVVWTKSDGIAALHAVTPEVGLDSTLALVLKKLGKQSLAVIQELARRADDAG